MVTVKLLAVLKEYARNGGCIEIPFTQGMTVADGLAATDIAGASIKYSVMVGNKRKKPEDILEDGDTLIVMPLLAGG